MSAEPDLGFTLIVLAAPRGPSALVCLSGEIDTAASAALSNAADRLAAVAPTTVVVDLANVTVADSTLITFVARLHRCLPAGSALLLCRPTTDVRQLLRTSGADQISTLRAELPRRPESARYRARLAD